jgi:hypothetical protein
MSEQCTFENGIKRARRGEGRLVTGKKCGEWEFITTAELAKIYPARILTRSEFDKAMESFDPGKGLP